MQFMQTVSKKIKSLPASTRVWLWITSGVVALLVAMFAFFPLFQNYLAAHAYNEPWPKDSIMYEDAQSYLAKGTARQMMIPYLWAMDKMMPGAFLHMSDLAEYVNMKDVFSFTSASGGAFKVLGVNQDNQSANVEVVMPSQIKGTQFTSQITCLPSLTMVADGRQAAATWAKLTDKQRQALNQLGGEMALAPQKQVTGTVMQTIKDFLSQPEAQNGTYAVYLSGRCADETCSKIQDAAGRCSISFLKGTFGSAQ